MPYKLDAMAFGRIFPGLIILLIGVAFFVLWLLLVFVSFFAFFIPELRGIFYLDLDILFASIVLMVVGGLLMLTGLSSWGQMDRGSWWTGGYATRRAERDRMNAGERVGEVFGVIISFLVLLFFIDNQLEHTGFFTSRFGPLEEALFYGSWIVGACVSLARAGYGRRNAIRPFDALNGALLAFTAFYLLSAFPFAFSHLPDLLPHSVRFAFSWVSNPIGAVFLALAGIGGLASMFYNSVTYFVVGARQRYGGAPHAW